MALISSHGRPQFPCTSTFPVHAQSLGHSICSINDTYFTVGYTNPGEGGSRELGQRGENPDFSSSLCLPGPPLLGLLPGAKQAGVKGWPKG